MHTIPPDMREKEKIFGGIFTASQMGWIAGGVVLGVIIGLILYQAISFFGFLTVPVGAGSGFFMAFYKIKDMTVLQYLRRKAKFKRKNKKYINRRARMNVDFTPETDEFLL